MCHIPEYRYDGTGRSEQFQGNLRNPDVNRLWTRQAIRFSRSGGNQYDQPGTSDHASRILRAGIPGDA
ncbi:hypothetical protein D3C80_1824380 [compost metagenome]